MKIVTLSLLATALTVGGNAAEQARSSKQPNIYLFWLMTLAGEIWHVRAAVIMNRPISMESPVMA